MTATVPWTWKSGDQIFLKFSVPIAQWTTNINLATDFTEYAYNTDSVTTAGATATTGSVSGRDGANFISIDSVTLASQTIKEVVFSRAIQDTDKILIELRDPTSGRWVIPSDIDWANRSANTAIYGIDVFPHPTDPFRARVRFGNAGRSPYNGAYGATNSQAWSGVSTWKWRVRKVSNGNMAEQPPVVRAEYTNQTRADTSTATALTYNTKVEDTHSAYNTTTGVFTAPIAGVYKFSCIALAGASASTFYWNIPVAGVQTTVVVEDEGGSNLRYRHEMSCRLLAGQTVFPTRSSLKIADLYCRFTAERIGS
jgi:hypothetical protein